MPHRYSRPNGFNNPSVYCDDIYRLIVHIRERVLDVLPVSLKERLLSKAQEDSEGIIVE